VHSQLRKYQQTESAVREQQEQQLRQDSDNDSLRRPLDKAGKPNPARCLPSQRITA